jgi:ketosteroid isomerase-like protein
MDDSSDSLAAAETALQEAVRTRDTGTLAGLLHDEVKFTGPDGSVIGKEEDLASHRDGSLAIDRLDEVSREVQLFGDTGITRIVLDMTVSSQDQTIAARLIYTRTWQKGENGWQVIAAQGSAIPIPN